MDNDVAREDLPHFIPSYKDEFKRSFGVSRIGLFGRRGEGTNVGGQ